MNNENSSLDNSQSQQTETAKSETFQSENSSDENKKNTKNSKEQLDKSKDILLDNFVILSEIGKGSFGKIYL